MNGFAISVTGLIWMLLIGALVGFLAGKIMKGSGFGVLGNIVVGIVGVDPRRVRLRTARHLLGTASSAA